MKPLAAVVLAISVLVAGSARAAPCVDLPHMSYPDAVITACTVEIQLSRSRVDVATAYTVRSHAYALKGDKDRALVDLNQALAVDPYLWTALVNRAVFYSQAGQLDLALKDYDDAILFHADVPEAYLDRAIAYDKKGEPDRAIADANEAIRRSPKFLPAHLFLVDHYLAAGKLEAADQETAAALALGAKPAALFNSRCWARAVAGREPKLALSDCNQALALAPNTASYLDSRGLVDLRIPDSDAAIKDYSAALAANPNQPTSLYGRSLAKRRKGDVAGADADAAAATAMDKTVGDQFARWGLNP